MNNTCLAACTLRCCVLMLLWAMGLVPASVLALAFGVVPMVFSRVRVLVIAQCLRLCRGCCNVKGDVRVAAADGVGT